MINEIGQTPQDNAYSITRPGSNNENRDVYNHATTNSDGVNASILWREHTATGGFSAGDSTTIDALLTHNGGKITGMSLFSTERKNVAGDKIHGMSYFSTVYSLNYKLCDILNGTINGVDLIIKDLSDKNIVYMNTKVKFKK